MSRFTDLFQPKEVKVSTSVPVEPVVEMHQESVEEPKETKVTSLLGRIKKRKLED